MNVRHTGNQMQHKELVAPAASEQSEDVLSELSIQSLRGKCANPQHETSRLESALTERLVRFAKAASVFGIAEGLERPNLHDLIGFRELHKKTNAEVLQALARFELVSERVQQALFSPLDDCIIQADALAQHVRTTIQEVDALTRKCSELSQIVDQAKRKESACHEELVAIPDSDKVEQHRARQYYRLACKATLERAEKLAEKEAQLALARSRHDDVLPQLTNQFQELNGAVKSLLTAFAEETLAAAIPEPALPEDVRTELQRTKELQDETESDIHSHQVQRMVGELLLEKPLTKQLRTYMIRHLTDIMSSGVVDRRFRERGWDAVLDNWPEVKPYLRNHTLLRTLTYKGAIEYTSFLQTLAERGAFELHAAAAPQIQKVLRICSRHLVDSRERKELFNRRLSRTEHEALFETSLLLHCLAEATPEFLEITGGQRIGFGLRCKLVYSRVKLFPKMMRENSGVANLPYPEMVTRALDHLRSDDKPSFYQ